MTVEVITVRNGEIIRGKLLSDHMKAYAYCTMRNWRVLDKGGRPCQLMIRLVHEEEK